VEENAELLLHARSMRHVCREIQMMEHRNSNVFKRLKKDDMIAYATL